MEKVVSRFLRYVRIHTESDPSAPPGVLPSAAREFDLARLLVDELRDSPTPMWMSIAMYMPPFRPPPDAALSPSSVCWPIWTPPQI